jgi:hypothetical protein
MARSQLSGEWLAAIHRGDNWLRAIFPGIFPIRARSPAIVAR